MTEIKIKQNENRKDYLIRVAVTMLRENGYTISGIVYDEAECDAFCLAEDLEVEFKNKDIVFPSEEEITDECFKEGQTELFQAGKLAGAIWMKQQTKQLNQ